MKGGGGQRRGGWGWGDMMEMTVVSAFPPPSPLSPAAAMMAPVDGCRTSHRMSCLSSLTEPKMSAWEQCQATSSTTPWSSEKMLFA